MLQLRLLGELSLDRDGHALPLPPSRKTRALLAYLALNPQPQRRERLCEIFWDVPDDPRGSLRWALSKLRGLIEADGTSRIEADRNTVSLRDGTLVIDLAAVRAAVATRDVAALIDAAAMFRGPFLADLDLNGAPEFQAWLLAAREDARQLQIRLLGALLDRLTAPEQALPHARELVRIDPLDEPARLRLIQLLSAAGRQPEAEEQHQEAVRALREVGGASPALLRALRAPVPEKRVEPPADEPSETGPQDQDLRFCVAPDGARIAYATVGNGPPLVKAANWLSHLEYDWESPVWAHMLRRFANRHRFVRYDARGTGLSDWDIDELSFDAWVSDLETVVDAAGVERFPLLGISQGCAISVAYAVKHPQRVSHLILFGGYAQGAHRRSAEESAQRTAMVTLMRIGWGRNNPMFRQLFASMFMPNGTKEQFDAFNALQQKTTTPECAARYYDNIAHFDVLDLLPQVKAPTLVMHVDNDAVAPIAFGREMARGIPGARFVVLPGENHLPLATEPAAARFFDEIERFLRAG